MDYEYRGYAGIDPSIETLRLTDLYLQTGDRQYLEQLTQRRAMRPEEIKDTPITNERGLVETIKSGTRFIYKEPYIEQEVEYA